jgi:hypothetical protein
MMDNKGFEKTIKQQVEKLAEDDLKNIKSFRDFGTIQEFNRFLFSLITNIDYLNIKVKELENRIDNLSKKED